MNYSNYRITLDVRNTVASVQLTAKKGDAGRKIYITLSDKGKPCEIADDSYAVFAGVKPDGTKLYNKTTIENNTIIYEMTQQTTAVAGLVACEVKLFDSMSNLLTSPKLTILVDDVVVPDEEIVSKDEVSALAELILDVTATGTLATEAADTANAAADNANASAQAANDAAASADRAAEVANAAAGNAASQANAASAAATTANNAANAATQAATAANEATTNANNAGDAVREQVSNLYEELAEKDRYFIDGELWNTENLPLDSYPREQIAISTSGIWKTAGSSKFIPVTDFVGKYISVTGHSTNGSVISFLPSNQYVNGGAANYVPGTVRTFIEAGETRVFTIPNECKFINVLDSWNGNFLPQSVSVYMSAFPKIMTGDRIGLTIDNWTDSACVFSTHYRSTGNAQGIVADSTSDLKASGFVPVYGKMLELPIPVITTTTFPNWGMSLYDADFNPIYGRAVSAIPNTVGDELVQWIHVYLPENASYFRTTYWTEEVTSAPPFTYNLLKEIPEVYKPITHELPVDTNMQNAIRRSRQLTDIKWTPRVKIPRYSLLNGSDVHFLDWFLPDHEYVGIPYSGAGKGTGTSSWTATEEWGYAHNWVGGCIPFESFVTAVRYPNSIFSETIGQTKPNYDSSPFGTVCTALVNYAVNGKWPLRSIHNFFETSDKVFRKAQTNNTVSEVTNAGFAIGDFLYTDEHVIFITDLLRDADGNITHVEMSEATTVGNGNNSIIGGKLGGVARRKMRDYTEFKTQYGAYVKYRRTTFFGIPYVASKHVDTGNEGDRENIVDLPCIPYLGNGAVYKVGYIHNSKICIGATGFNTLVVKKDGAEFGTFALNGETEISVGFTDVGNYEAYLTNDTSKTMSCHWTVEE